MELLARAGTGSAYCGRMETATPGPGDTSAAPPPAPDFATYEREATARDLGRSTPTTTADPSPAPAEGAASATADRADSPPAPPDDKKPKNLQTRTEQINREVADLQEKIRLRKALREELATLDPRPQPAQPASDPARPKPQSWERYKTLPGAPKPDDFPVYEDYLDARAEFIADQRYEERERRATADRESQGRVEADTKRISTFTERITKAREADPDFDGKVHPYLLTELVPAFALPPGTPWKPANVLLQEIVDSQASAALLLHFSTPDGQKQWQELVTAAQESPAAMIRGFGRIEARFLSDGTAAEPKAPAKPVTSAPDPPTVLGTRPPQQADRAAAAVSAGDYSAYERQRIAADLARR